MALSKAAAFVGVMGRDTFGPHLGAWPSGHDESGASAMVSPKKPT